MRINWPSGSDAPLATATTPGLVTLDQMLALADVQIDDATQLDWNNIPLANGWESYGLGYTTPQWAVLGDLVFLKGMVKNGYYLSFMTPVGAIPKPLGVPIFMGMTGSVSGNTWYRYEPTNDGRLRLRTGGVYTDNPNNPVNWAEINGAVYRRDLTAALP